MSEEFEILSDDGDCGRRCQQLEELNQRLTDENKALQQRILNTEGVVASLENRVVQMHKQIAQLLTERRRTAAALCELADSLENRHSDDEPHQSDCEFSAEQRSQCPNREIEQIEQCALSDDEQSDCAAEKLLRENEVCAKLRSECAALRLRAVEGEAEAQMLRQSNNALREESAAKSAKIRKLESKAAYLQQKSELLELCLQRGEGERRGNVSVHEIRELAEKYFRQLVATAREGSLSPEEAEAILIQQQRIVQKYIRDALQPYMKELQSLS